DCPRQFFETFFTRVRGGRPFLRLEGQEEVFDALGGLGDLDRVPQFVGQLSLRVDRLEDRLFSFGQVAQGADASSDDAEPVLVQSAGAIFAIAGDERRSVALVQKLDSRLNLDLAELEVLSNPGQIERWRVGNVRHGAGHYVGPNAAARERTNRWGLMAGL